MRQPPAPLTGGARPDCVRNLARYPYAPRLTKKCSAIDHYLAAQYRHLRPTRHFMALPRAVVGFMQILDAHSTLHVWIENDEIGVAADGYCALTGIKPHNARGVRGHEIGKALERISSFHHHFRIHDAQSGLHPCVAAG